MLFELWLLKIMPYTKPIMIISNEIITIDEVSKSKMSTHYSEIVGSIFLSMCFKMLKNELMYV